MHLFLLFVDLWFQTFNRIELRPLAGETLNRAHQTALGRIDQRHRKTGTPGAAGTADAMHVVFRLARRVEVDHMADTGDIDAARGDVGSNQHTGAAVTQTFERAVALPLVHVAVQRMGSKTVFAQQAGQIIGAAFGRRKHQRLLNVGVAQDRIEQFIFVRHVVGKHETLLDVGFRLRGRSNLDALGIAGDLARHRPDHAVERRREQQGLASRRRLRNDRLDVFNETHVEHAVGFVKDQHFETAEIDPPALHVIHQAARRGDHHINRTLQSFQLRRVGHATDQAGDAELLQFMAVVERGLVHLQREFARRRQHQDAWTVALDGRINREAIKARQHEGCRLAAAGVGRHQQVGAGQRSGNRFDLHRRRLLIAGFFERVEDDRVQTQIGKSSRERHDTKPFISRACTTGMAIADPRLRRSAGKSR